MITDALIPFAQREIDAFLGDIQGVQAILVATVDGYHLAHACRQDINESRLAAIASTMSAIGDIVTEEANLGKSKLVMIEAEAGFVIVHSVACSGRNLVVNVLSNRSATIGMVLLRLSECARRLANSGFGQPRVVGVNEETRKHLIPL